MDRITVVGGGLAGLVAATTCAESGLPVRVLEARSRLGGRAATAPGPYRANLGPHAFYTGPLWSWLEARSLHRPFRRPGRSVAAGIRVRWQGSARRFPPTEVLQLFRHRRRQAPVDRSLRDWLTGELGPEATAAAAGLAGVLTFDHDPGRLSAAFVWPRLGRILLSFPPAARYVEGGWGTVIERMERHARGLGVDIEVGAKVADLDDLARHGPVVLAVGPSAARALTGDGSLRVESPRVALLDVGLRSRRHDPYLVSDLDGGAFVDRFTAVDRSLAPSGHELVQCSVGQRPAEELDVAVARIEAVLDQTFSGWRDRATWRRRSSVIDSTGAVDLPGTTWRDRPAIGWSPDLSICGDWVAAPGHLAEVSWASAVAAAERATAGLRRATVRSP